MQAGKIFLPSEKNYRQEIDVIRSAELMRTDMQKMLNLFKFMVNLRLYHMHTAVAYFLIVVIQISVMET